MNTTSTPRGRHQLDERGGIKRAVSVTRMCTHRQQQYCYESSPLQVVEHQRTEGYIGLMMAAAAIGTEPNDST